MASWNTILKLLVLTFGCYTNQKHLDNINDDMSNYDFEDCDFNIYSNIIQHTFHSLQQHR